MERVRHPCLWSLLDGVWNGHRMLPEGWVSYTRSPAPADLRRRYGAHFWLAVPDEYRGKGELPQDVFHAAGHEAQFVTVVPSRDAVIVRLGLTRYADAWDHVGVRARRAGGTRRNG
jgi:CubicO group peptidase (beta-lactamase class C family)